MVISGRLICVIRVLTADSNICTSSAGISAIILKGGGCGDGLSWEETVIPWRNWVIKTKRWRRPYVCQVPVFQTK